MEISNFRHFIILFLALLSANLFFGCGGKDKPKNFALKDGNNVIFQTKKPFIFEKGQGILINAKENEGSNLDALNDFLYKNDDKKLLINGLYSEKLDDGNSQVGKKRAEAMKNFLLKASIDKSLIQVNSQASNDITIIKDKVYNPFRISIIERDDETTKNRKFAATFKKSKFTYNYAIMQSTCKMNPDLQSYLDNLKLYISQKPNAKILIEGHTDITGTLRLNNWLSRARSNKLKKLLAKNGIYVKNVKTKGYGPKKPVATNKTKSGRAKNRRSEVSIAK